MYDYRKQMLKEYHEKLEEYRELLGALPTDETATLERIISNPENEREMDFCINCLKFFNYSTKGFTNITEELRQNKISERDIDRWLENIDGLLYHHRYTFVTKKEYYQNLLEQRKDLIQKIQIWTNETLTSILLEPTTDEEYRLCQEYLSYLSDEVDFKERKDKYLERLMNRQETIKELSKSSYKTGMIEILLDPRTEKELDFCISYFGFQDDIKFISEAAKEGKVTKPNIGVTSDVMFFGDYYFEQPTNQAKTLYDLTVLEQTDHEALMKLLQEKGEYPSLPTEEYEHFKEYLDAQIIKGISREEIAKGLSSKPLGRFNAFAQDLHQRYLTGMSYEDATPTTLTPTSSKRTKEDEVREYAEQQGYQYIKTLME